MPLRNANEKTTGTDDRDPHLLPDGWEQSDVCRKKYSRCCVKGCGKPVAFKGSAKNEPGKAFLACWSHLAHPRKKCPGCSRRIVEPAGYFCGETLDYFPVCFDCKGNHLETFERWLEQDDRKTYALKRRMVAHMMTMSRLPTATNPQTEEIPAPDHFPEEMGPLERSVPAPDHSPFFGRHDPCWSNVFGPGLLSPRRQMFMTA